ncbi:M4 family metallopeptidase [Nocardioides sp. cx-173]|uniref:M4 family metallopeptidase n=1 Tax=Nocardioides sp. cx-173 TaxID=2898796 RepID=UPI001E503275|nr:M4 family metallopeptidase [Nocardioides sp. cx-173]MCD4524902.1 M4 family metallopeptidase [Nocardioides sp. cx-173]UGB43404.1 M4 family metallopeptidase [Nocardioides sp. cx-173]
MRTSLGLAVAAVLAAGTLGAQATSAAGAPTLAADRQHPVTGALAALAQHPTAARSSAGQEFLPGGTVVDPDGSTHVRLERTYSGLPVLGGDLVVHRGPAAGWEGVSQTLAAPLELATTPAVAGTTAQERALSAAGALKGIRNLRAGDRAPRLVVDALVATPRLAWEVTTLGRHADGTPSRLATYVDARSGQVLRREERIQTVDGSGQSLYSGAVPIQVARSGSAYTLTDPTRGNAKTTDMQNRQDSILCQVLGAGCSNGVAYSSPDTSFGNGTSADRESAAVDAHYGGAVTFDYFKQVHARNGIFGDGTGAPSRVHYGKGYVNAFWDGTKMTYGDGDGVEFGPLVSLDVAGHEMSHGVTENTAGLTYSGESGGLNEATSDIFGTMVEFYAANAADPADYLVGEEFDLAGHQGLRRMDNPIADGSSPNCWSANTKNLDVHYSSGVGNHFFYLLAEGSGAKIIGGVAHSSSTCNGTTVTGIGRDAAQRIWFRALDVYMTSGTTYAQARTATLSAAADLYGAGSAQHTAVASAWSAVSVS